MKLSQPDGSDVSGCQGTFSLRKNFFHEVVFPAKNGFTDRGGVSLYKYLDTETTFKSCFLLLRQPVCLPDFGYNTGLCDANFKHNMDQVPSASLIVADWHQCRDSKEYFSKILHKKRRKNFGNKFFFLFFSSQTLVGYKPVNVVFKH